MPTRTQARRRPRRLRGRRRFRPCSSLLGGRCIRRRAPALNTVCTPTRRPPQKRPARPRSPRGPGPRRTAGSPPAATAPRRPACGRAGRSCAVASPRRSCMRSRVPPRPSTTPSGNPDRRRVPPRAGRRGNATFGTRYPRCRAEPREFRRSSADSGGPIIEKRLDAPPPLRLPTTAKPSPPCRGGTCGTTTCWRALHPSLTATALLSTMRPSTTSTETLGSCSSVSHRAGSKPSSRSRPRATASLLPMPTTPCCEEQASFKGNVHPIDTVARRHPGQPCPRAPQRRRALRRERASLAHDVCRPRAARLGSLPLRLPAPVRRRPQAARADCVRSVGH
jgi:hypothetical protein